MASSGSMHLCRAAELSEVDIFLNLWKELSWEPDDHYPAGLYNAIGADGFRVICPKITSDDGDTTNPPIGCFLAAHYEEVGFLGYFSILSQYQGQGFGKALLQDCIDYLHGQACTSIGLDAVPAAFKLYEQYGFKSSGKKITWFYLDIEPLPSASKGAATIGNLHEIDITTDLQAVQAFIKRDEQVTGFQRANILQKLLQIPGWRLFQHMGSRDLADCFIASRRIPNGYALGPIYASTFEQAQEALNSTVLQLRTGFDTPSDAAHKTQFAVETWSENPLAHKLFEQCGWREDSHFYNRMWLGPEPEGQKVCKEGIYAVLDSGLG